MDEKTARQQGMTDVSSLGASSSGMTASPGVGTSTSVAEKRRLDNARNDDEAPIKCRK